jgi:hypothetical protein
VVDPGSSGGGFDDVQDLHEPRVVMVRLSMNALKTIPQKGTFVQRTKLQPGFVKGRASLSGASKTELKRIGANFQRAQAGCKV